MTEPVTVHLSVQELFECLAVGVNDAQAEHLKACERCAMGLRRNEMVAADARKTVSKWAESLQSSDRAFLNRLMESHLRRRECRFAQLAAAVLLVLLVPAAVVEQRRMEQKVREADEVLLQQVDEEIAERVPTAMQPLTRLVTWESATESTQQKQAAGEGKK